MVNISIYPYGNANEKGSAGSYTFTCQHGENECDGNMVETCYINAAKWDQTNFMPFILDFESQLSKTGGRNAYSSAQTLLNTGNYGLKWSDISACVGTSGQKGGTTGNAEEHQMALWTNQANHQYTPWITLEGKHTTTIQNECSASTLQCTCSKYTGTNSCCTRLEDEMGVCFKRAKGKRLISHN